MSDDLRAELETNYDAELDAKVMASKVFDYYKSMGGEPSREDTAAGGWSDEQHAHFVNLLKKHAPKRESFAQSVTKGLTEAGLTSEQGTHESGIPMVTVGTQSE
jgi:hypothetical protein